MFTAIFGYNFCRGGQQAFKHLSSNALRVSAINSVGDFVLFLGKALVVVATILIGIKMLDVSYQHFVLKLLILCHTNAEKLNIPCHISQCIKGECCGRTTILMSQGLHSTDLEHIKPLTPVSNRVACQRYVCCEFDHVLPSWHVSYPK